jgi:hypothetical protein
MSDAEELVRRVLETHNTDPDALLDVFEDLFSPDFEFRPITVGTERMPYRGREGLEGYYGERAALEAARA